MIMLDSADRWEARWAVEKWVGTALAMSGHNRDAAAVKFAEILTDPNNSEMLITVARMLVEDVQDHQQYLVEKYERQLQLDEWAAMAESRGE
jgi:hypothetical protein